MVYRFHCSIKVYSAGVDYCRTCWRNFYKNHKEQLRGSIDTIAKTCNHTISMKPVCITLQKHAQYETSSKTGRPWHYTRNRQRDATRVNNTAHRDMILVDIQKVCTGISSTVCIHEDRDR